MSESPLRAVIYFDPKSPEWQSWLKANDYTPVKDAYEGNRPMPRADDMHNPLTIVEGKIYATCYGCGKFVRVNKPFFGSLHICAEKP